MASPETQSGADREWFESLIDRTSMEDGCDYNNVVLQRVYDAIPHRSRRIIISVNLLHRMGFIRGGV